jgi:hypothetical protein
MPIAGTSRPSSPPSWRGSSRSRTRTSWFENRLKSICDRPVPRGAHRLHLLPFRREPRGEDLVPWICSSMGDRTNARGWTSRSARGRVAGQGGSIERGTRVFFPDVKEHPPRRGDYLAGDGGDYSIDPLRPGDGRRLPVRRDEPVLAQPRPVRRGGEGVLPGGGAGGGGGRIRNAGCTTTPGSACVGVFTLKSSTEIGRRRHLFVRRGRTSWGTCSKSSHAGYHGGRTGARSGWRPEGSGGLRVAWWTKDNGRPGFRRVFRSPGKSLAMQRSFQQRRPLLINGTGGLAVPRGPVPAGASRGPFLPGLPIVSKGPGRWGGHQATTAPPGARCAVRHGGGPPDADGVLPAGAT